MSNRPVGRAPAVRLADPADVPDLAALRRVERGSGEGDDPDFDRRIAAWFSSEGDRRLTWVAELEGVAVGCVSLFDYRRMPVPGQPDRGWGYLSNMFVLEPHRNAGIGRALLDAAIEAADRRGYARIVLAPSIRSIPFYERAGFIDAGPGAGPDRLMVRAPRS